jgi:hypothetical protein
VTIENFELERYRSEWLDLAPGSACASTYFHPEVLEQRRGGALVHRQPRPDATVASLAVLVPRAVRVLQMWCPGEAGYLSGYRVVADGLLGAADARAASTFIGECCDLLDRGGCDCILFEDLDVESELWTQAHQAAEEGRTRILEPRGTDPHWWIEFPDLAEEYWHSFSSKTRSTFRRKCNRLPHTITRIERPEEVREFLAGVTAISGNTWQFRRLGPRARTAAYEREFYERLARAGALRCYLLKHENGQPLAFMIGIQHGTVFVYEEVGYDSDYARQSPGTVLLYRVLADLFEYRPVRRLDFGPGHAAYKERFANHCTESGPLLMVANRWRPAMTVRLELARRALDHGARALLRRTRLYDRLRRRYRA